MKIDMTVANKKRAEKGVPEHIKQMAMFDAIFEKQLSLLNRKNSLGEEFTEEDIKKLKLLQDGWIKLQREARAFKDEGLLVGKSDKEALKIVREAISALESNIEDE